MSFEVDEITNLKKCKKRHRLSTFCRTIFGCAAKKKSYVEQRTKSIAIQCQVEKELGRISFLEDNTKLFGSNTKFDLRIAGDDIYPQTDEFKSSLKKLDSLINTLNEIQGLYKRKSLKSRELVADQYSKYENEVSPEDKENISGFDAVGKLTNWNSERNEFYNPSEEEMLKFNINFDKNNFIQCHTSKGKNSLKIIQNSDRTNINPLILHRCESEFVLTKNSEIACNYKVKSGKSSTEISNKETNQLQRSYHTLPGHFGKSLINFSSFRSNLVDHMRNIKEDVVTLRNLLYSIEYLVREEERPIVLPICFESIKNWFVEREPDIIYNMYDKQASNELLQLEGSKYTEARIRAANFCKFYTLAKLIKSKQKPKKYKKIQIL